MIGVEKEREPGCLLDITEGVQRAASSTLHRPSPAPAPEGHSQKHTWVTASPSWHPTCPQSAQGHHCRTQSWVSEKRPQHPDIFHARGPHLCSPSLVPSFGLTPMVTALGRTYQCCYRIPSSQCELGCMGHVGCLLNERKKEWPHMWARDWTDRSLGQGFLNHREEEGKQEVVSARMSGSPVSAACRPKQDSSSSKLRFSSSFCSTSPHVRSPASSTSSLCCWLCVRGARAQADNGQMGGQVDRRIQT